MKNKHIVWIPQVVLSHQVTKARLLIKNKNETLQAAVDLIMRLKLPHTFLGRTNLLWFIVGCFGVFVFCCFFFLSKYFHILDGSFSSSLLCFRIPQKVLLPPLLYKFLVHIVNREVSEQLFGDIFYLYSKACNIYIKVIC